MLKYNPLLSGKLDMTKGVLNDLDDLNTVGATAGNVLTYQGGTWVARGTVVEEQIPNLSASKIVSGTFGIARIPAMDDAHIPNLETLSFGVAFGTAQIPSLGAYKIASGTLNAERIPVLPTDRYGSAVLVSGERTLTANLNFGSHEAVNIQLEQLGSHPAAARARIYYNTTDDNIYVYIGTV